MMLERDWYGRFICKSYNCQKVWVIRVIDKVWKEFGEIIDQRGITRVDLLEEIVRGDYELVINRQVILILRKVLNLKADVGGVIKK